MVTTEADKKVVPRVDIKFKKDTIVETQALTIDPAKLPQQVGFNCGCDK